MEPVEVGIVGLGWWSGRLAGAIQRSPHLKLAACYSRTPERTEAFAAQFDCVAKDTFEDLLRHPGLEGVILATPNSQHRAGTELAARFGKHVFVEKPIATTLEDAEAMATACRKARVILSVGHSYRRHVGMRRLGELVAEGVLGRISLAECVFSKGRGLTLDPGDWRAQAEEVPGGCLMQIGIHHIDNLLYLLGSVDKVQAMFARLEAPGSMSDVAGVLLSFTSGAIGQVAADYVSADRFTLTLYGTEAIATFDLVDGLSLQWRGSHDLDVLNVRGNDYLREQMDEFATCIREKKPPEVDGTEATRSLAIVLAAVRAAAEERAVSITETVDRREGITQIRID